MTTNHIQSVANAFSELELKFQTNEDKLLVGFGLDGVTFHVLVHTAVNGNVLMFDARGFFDTEKVQASKHKSAFALYLLQLNWQTPAGAFEMDSDGEVGLTFEVPMADAQVTVRQVALIVDMLQSKVQSVVTGGNAVLQTGELPTEEVRSGSTAMAELAQLVKLQQQMAALADSDEGRAMLAQVAVDKDMPGAVRQLAQMVLSSSVPDEL